MELVGKYPWIIGLVAVPRPKVYHNVPLILELPMVYEFFRTDAQCISFKKKTMVDFAVSIF
jgi:hypothetical protein